MAEVTTPSLSTRSSRRWAWGTGVLLVVIVAALLWSRPEELVRGLPFGLLAALVVAVVASARTHVDAERGTVRRTRWFSPSRTVRVDEADAVGLVGNNNGALHLAVRKGRRGVRVPVLALTTYVEKAQDPRFVRSLAQMLDQHARGSDELATALRAQASHTESGGEPADSPLAGLVRHGTGRAAGAGGAGAAGGGLGRLLDG